MYGGIVMKHDNATVCKSALLAAVVMTTVLAGVGYSATFEVGYGQPYATINDAVAAAQSGDTIVIHGGTYDLANFSSTYGANGLTFTRYGNDKVIIDKARLEISSTTNLTFEGIIFRCNEGSYGGVYVRWAPNGGHTFRNCVFMNEYPRFAINAYGGSGNIDNVTIENCTFVNSLTGINTYGGNTNNWVVKDCLFVGLTDYGVNAADAASPLTADYCAFWNNGTDVGGYASLGTGCVTTTEPVFVSTDINDPGYLVLADTCPAAITEGASDGSFIGAFGLTLSSNELVVGTGQPFAAIADALAVAVPGDKIIIHEGTYGLQDFVYNDGLNNLTFEAFEDDKVVIDEGRVEIYNTRGLTFDGLIFQGNEGSYGAVYLRNGNASYPNGDHTFRNCVFMNEYPRIALNAYGGGGSIDNVTVDNCTFVNSTAGINTYGGNTNNWVVKDCLFIGLTNYAVNASDPGSPITVENSAFWNNGANVSGHASLGSGCVTTVEPLFSSTTKADFDYLYLAHNCPDQILTSSSDGGYVGARNQLSCLQVLDLGYGHSADLNTDCYVEWADFGIFASQWQACMEPTDPDCTPTW